MQQNNDNEFKKMFQNEYSTNNRKIQQIRVCFTLEGNEFVKYGKKEDGNVDYVKGANVAGFVKVADAMIDQGLV